LRSHIALSSLAGYRAP